MWEDVHKNPAAGEASLEVTRQQLLACMKSDDIDYFNHCKPDSKYLWYKHSTHSETTLQRNMVNSVLC